MSGSKTLDTKSPTTFASVCDSFVSLSAQYNGRTITSYAECTSPVEGMQKALRMMPLGRPVDVTVYQPTRSRDGMTRAKVMLQHGDTSYPGFAKHEDPSAAIAEAGLNALLYVISSGSQAAQYAV